MIPSPGHTAPLVSLGTHRSDTSGPGVLGCASGGFRPLPPGPRVKRGRARPIVPRLDKAPAVVRSPAMSLPIILAGLLSLGTPGRSEASRVPAHELEQGAALDFEARRGTWPGWTRPETYPEGLRRYAVIARAMDAVQRRPPRRWRGSGPELWRALAAIVRQESAMWRGVHDGTIRGSAGEVCLVQLHPRIWASLGIADPAEVLGVDLEATERCLRAGAELLARSRGLCPSLPGGDQVDGEWFAYAVQAYGSGKGCALPEPWVQPRLESYQRTAERKPLPFLAQVAIVLELEPPDPPPAELEPGALLADL